MIDDHKVASSSTYSSEKIEGLLDSVSGGGSVSKVFATVDAALNTFTSGRFIGLTAYIINEGNEYWFFGGTDDINFVPKAPSFFRWNTMF